ncbi:MAG: helix-turn-helix transcriptional regulator [Firmicutes bacterium]|nr:helix-turn-helix transcriptional regulator [Bacillota bacterium]MCI9049193.1 helix-turn-helix transcriptional regulator [Coprobacillus sp.]
MVGDLNNTLKNKRIEKKLTQAKLAQMANISERQYRRIETGEQTPSVEVALLLAKALHTTVEKLFPLQASANAGEDKPNNKQA